MPSLIFVLVLFSALALLTAIETYLGHHGMEGIGPLEDLLIGVGFTAIFALVTCLGYWFGYAARRNRLSRQGESVRAALCGLIATALVAFSPEALPEFLSHRFISPLGSVVVFAAWLSIIGALLAWLPLPMRRGKQ